MLDFLESLGRFAQFGLRSLLGLPSAIRRPAECAIQLQRIFLGALPLGLVGGLALGAVTYIHLRGPLIAVGGPRAVDVLPQALALAVVLELAPIVAGLIVAGRSGASLGAELGSMRLTEQVDALEMMGLSPLRELIVPRVLGCIIALPMLTVFISYSAITAGYVAEMLSGSMSWLQYQNECLRLLRLEDVIPAMLKTMVFGYLIGITGCYSGMNASGGTEGVGRAATRGVVLSIFLVMVSNVAAVLFIQAFL